MPGILTRNAIRSGLLFHFWLLPCPFAVRPASCCVFGSTMRSTHLSHTCDLDLDRPRTWNDDPWYWELLQPGRNRQCRQPVREPGADIGIQKHPGMGQHVAAAYESGPGQAPILAFRWATISGHVVTVSWALHGNLLKGIRMLCFPFCLDVFLRPQNPYLPTTIS